MPLRRIRLSTRRTLILVGAVAVGCSLGLEVLALRRASSVYQRLAQAHALRARDHSGRADSIARDNIEPFAWKAEYEGDRNMRTMWRLAESGRRRAERERRLAAYHESLAWKYRRAANFPLRPVEPDPSETK